MRRAVVLMMLLALGRTYAGELDRSEFKVPRGMSFYMRTDGAPPHTFTREWFTDRPYTEFRGRVRLTGDLIVEIDRTKEDLQQSGAVETFFRPDAASLARLPQVVGTYYSDEPVGTIDLLNSPQDLLRNLLGPAWSAAMLRADDNYYEIPTQLTVTRYVSYIECAHRSYLAYVEGIGRKHGHHIFKVAMKRDDLGGSEC